MRPHPDTHDVLIVGLGPVGAVAATLLGLHGVRVLVIDQGFDPYPLPRAIAFDGEALRILAALELGDELPAMNAHQHVRFLGARGQMLAEVAFDDEANGMPGLSFFLQPELERALRDGLARQPTVDVALGWELEGFVDSGDAITARLREVETGARRFATASYLLGCDGASSTVRRRLGIGFGGSTYEERWLVVDLAADGPIAHLPYYTAHCDPGRPFVDMPSPGGHRFEWMLHPGESAERMADPACVRRLLSAHLDPDAVEVLRAVVYTFHARVAERWRHGRAFLLGDAAHAMPPFAGQGLASGLGDAINVAWKLAAVLDGRAGDALLESYERERRPHVQAMIRLNRFLGAVLQTRDARLAAVRDTLLGTASRMPALGSWLRGGGPKPDPVLPRRARQRLVGRRAATGGMRIPRARLRTLDGRVERLDDVLGHRFALLGLELDPRAALDATARELWDRLGAEYFRLVPRGRRHASTNGRPSAGERTLELEDLDGTLVSFVRRRGEIAIVRPDRYVLAVPRAGELNDASRAYAAIATIPERLATTLPAGLRSAPQA
jgi:3-(3-hydroxy-phenyl)propionate hydroxylase